MTLMRGVALPLPIVVLGSAIAACTKQALWAAALQQLVAAGPYGSSETVCHLAQPETGFALV